MCWQVVTGPAGLSHVAQRKNSGARLQSLDQLSPATLAVTGLVAATVQKPSNQ
jgi:hypothetical protein